jgi:signal transduction histidine kinase
MVRGPNATLSNARNNRGNPASKQVTPDVGPSAAGSAAADGPTANELVPEHDSGQPPGAGPAYSPSSRRALKNWRVRSRLFLLVVIPTVTAVAAGGIFIASSVQSAFVYQRVLTLANLSGKITGLVQALQNERGDTVRYIVMGNSNGGRGASASSAIPSGPHLGLLTKDHAIADGWADQVKTLADGIGGSYSALAQQDSKAAVTTIGNLPAIRAAATGTKLPALIVIQEYATAISSLLAIESQIAVGSSDSTLAGEVRVLGLVSSMKEEASLQQALLTSTLRSDLVSLGQFSATHQAALTDAQAQQQGDLNGFNAAATPEQRQLFNSVLSGPKIVQAQAQEQQAISLASSRSPNDPTISDASSSLSYVVSGMRSVEQQFADSVISRSGSLHDSAITSAIIFGLAVALLLGIALVATTIIGRSMVGPLRRLRNGALEVAGTRLPETVRRMSETGGEDISPEVAPIDVDSSDEIGEVARAFDQVHKEAVRLAANEAALRGNVNAMFVNLSRRSQSLVERQIRLITKLEQGEQDSKRLASLFQMDHLATRMRRNSENLLVLAGQELSRRWSRPVALVDVLRAAASEIEQYERVTLNVQPGISIRRETVSDVVHLTAELVENATSFSEAGTPVLLAAQLQGNGWTLIEVTDQGVGMSAEQIGHANWRLANPPVMDVAVSRRMGLFVVARLAARHGIRVRLCPVPSGGLIAQVWLPAEVITRDTGSTARDTGSPARDTGSPSQVTGNFGPVRTAAMASPNQAAAENQAVASIADKLKIGIREPGHAMPQRMAGRDNGRDGGRDNSFGQNGIGQNGIGQNGFGLDGFGQNGFGPGSTGTGSTGTGSTGPNVIVPDPRLLPTREDPAAAGRHPLANGPVQRAETPAATGPLPRLGRRLRAEPGAGYGPRETGPGPQRNGADSGPAGPAAAAPSGEIVVPPAGNGAHHQRLPIFDAVESDWFRRGGQTIGGHDQKGQPNQEGSTGWASSSDEGWRAAEVVHAPTSDGTTPTGLPKRVPQANLVPGKVAGPAGGEPAGEPSPASLPSRSAAETRDRLASFQHGIRRGRAAAFGGDSSAESTTS